MSRRKSNQDSLTRERYIEDLKQRAQFDVINGKTGSVSSTDVMTWTNRNTGCDVISLVTTSKPFLHGGMKDLQIKLEKSHNVKPNPGSSGSSVYTKALHPDSDHNNKERYLMNKILHAEKDKFFRRLKAARVARSTFETTAAVVIQAVVRGYMVRKHLHKIQATCRTTKELRIRLKRVFSANMGCLVPNLSVYRNCYKDKRGLSALQIQCTFRIFVSRRFLARKKAEVQMNMVSRSILRIQCCGRRYNSKKRVNVIRERKTVARRLNAAIRIQTVVRKKLATQRMKKRRYMFRWLAARMIQGFYRHIYSKRKSLGRRAGMVQRRRQRGALALQQVARAYVSRLRTGRIRDRKKFLHRFNAATRIARIIRAFICRHRVVRLRTAKEEERKAQLLERQEETNRKAAEETRALLEDSDLFHQARKGHATEVDDIFTGLMSDEPHETTEVDEFGDTLLLIAASSGHLEIVRKSLIWGFDINFRNEITGYSAVSLAAQNKHFEVVQYLLNPPLSKSSVKEAVATNIVWSADDVGVVLTSVACHSNNVSLMSALIEILGQGALEIKHADTGETAYHAAFKGGNADMVKLLLKYANDETFKSKDDNGKTLYHCAAESSMEMINMLADVDPMMTDALMEGHKDELLLKTLKQVENNGKSCLLVAALHGSDDVLKQAKALEAIVAAPVEEPVEGDADVEIGWSPADIDAAVKTAEGGHVTCIRFLIEAGFDPSWANDETGKSIVMACCEAGRLGVLDSLMQTGTSFLETDAEGRTAIHYACMCTSESVLSFLLSHGKASSCNINGMCLTIEDKKGYTPLHIAAKYGSNLSVDLLAQDGIAAGINKISGSCGMSPLMQAAASGKTETISRLLVLEADPKAVDASGHSVLWHLLQSSQKADEKPGAASTRLGISSACLELARAGCPIISTCAREAADWCRRREDVSSGRVKRVNMEVVEMLAVDKNTTFMRSLAKTLEPEFCWEAVLAAIAFDGPDSVMYNALMAGGADEILLKIPDAKYLSSGGGSATTGSVARIMDIIYKGYTLHGWAIILNNVGLLMKLIDKYPLSSAPLDLEGNTAFHIAACHSSVEMVDCVLGHGHVIVEAVNKKGRTALMEGMMSGNFKSLIRIAKSSADPRRGLERRYDAWLLALARKRERNEKNLQTGQIQEDDENVCPMAPDPDYLFWYVAPK